MSRRNLSPSILAALGLSACVDGCDPAELPVVGRLFDAGDEDDDGVHPCLKVSVCLSEIAPSPPPPVGPCLEAPMVDTGPCLEIAPAQPVTAPTPVHPCLKMVPSPRPPPDDRKCLSRLPAPDAIDGAVRPSRVDVLAKLEDADVLPQDVRERLSEG